MCEAAQVVVESCLVTPSSETPRTALWLSPLDRLMATRGRTPFVQFHRRPPASGSDFFDVARLKTALGRALVPFYPFAGRLDVGRDGRFQIDCSGEGVLFLVARNSRLTVGDLGGFKPSPELRRLLVPSVDGPAEADHRILCAIQVTFFKCGGVAIGMALHHAATDVGGAFHFLQTWAALCKDGERAVVEPPCHDRTLLSPRHPPVVRPGTLSVFRPTLTLSRSPSGPLATEAFDLARDRISALKRACGGGGVSTFCAVTAHVWRCMCLARRLPPGTTTRLVFAASVRRSLAPPLPDRYFGNAVIFLGVAGEARDVAGGAGGLASVAGRIKGAIGRMDDELVRSAVDYHELDKCDGQPGPGNIPATDLRVISWLGLPLYDVDFGWGKPAAVMRAESTRGGFVHLMDSSHGDGAVCVVICMEAALLHDFKRLLLHANHLNSMI